MVRHDGMWLLPHIFPERPDVTQLLALHDLIFEQVWWNVPLIMSQTLLLAELVRTIPAEVAMVTRIIKRKKPNLAEAMFFSIKYCALFAFICTTTFQMTKLPTSDASCNAYSLGSTLFMYAIGILVSLTIAWRTWIVHHGSRKVLLLLALGSTVQIALSCWSAIWNWTSLKLSPTGICIPTASKLHGSGHISFWKLSVFYYTMWNTFFDMAMITASCLRLWRTARGPAGFARISSLLFQNNVHYAVAVDAINIVHLVLLVGWRDDLPNFQNLILAVQASIGMQLLIGEQEAVYGQPGSRGGSSSNGSSYNRNAHQGSGSRDCGGTEGSLPSSNTSGGGLLGSSKTKRGMHGGNSSSSTSSRRRLGTADSSRSDRSLTSGQMHLSQSVLVTYDEGSAFHAVADPKLEKVSSQEQYQPILLDHSNHLATYPLDSLDTRPFGSPHHNNSSTCAIKSTSNMTRPSTANTVGSTRTHATLRFADEIEVDNGAEPHHPRAKNDFAAAMVAHSNASKEDQSGSSSSHVGPVNIRTLRANLGSRGQA